MASNSRFTFAVHVLALLASSSDPLSSTTIAASVNAHPVTIRNLIGVLHQAGMVNTMPGSSGGSVLARPASRITLAEVADLVKEDRLFALHPNQPNPECPVGRNIQAVLEVVFDDLEHLLADALSKITIADIMAQLGRRINA
jgi:Rrf2 family protein